MVTTTTERNFFPGARLRATALSAAALLPCLLASFAGAAAPTGTGPEDEPRFVGRTKEARALAEAVDALARIEFQGAVFAAKDGAPLVAIGLGHADLEGQVDTDANTLFEIASASKQFTAAAILRLVEQKKLALDDSIAQHLEGVPENCRAITVRHLLQHTSGIPGSNSQGGGTDLAAVVPIFLAGGPQHTPGTHFEYWNQGYALLAGIVARVSGDSFVEFSTDELFAPAKMANTTFTGGSAKKRTKVAIGRTSNGEPRSALEHPYGEFGYQYQGMGGVVTNAWDLWRWDRALAANEALTKKSQAELFAPGLENYALGWTVEERNGRLVQHHGGGVRGFICQVRRFPTDDACLFVLCNDDGMPLWEATDYVEAALFGAEPVLPPLPLSPQAAADLVGTYEDERGTRLTIERRGATTHATLEYATGQRTAAYIGLDDEGQLVLWDWRERHAARLGDDGALSVFSASFRRVP
jgi:CubicO group peptidase (beta-lactamase class C family)